MRTRKLGHGHSIMFFAPLEIDRRIRSLASKSPEDDIDTTGILHRCKRLGILSLRNVGMDEEQEREVIHEAEREREVERPPRVRLAIHSLHPDVAAFVKTGIIPANTNSFCPAFETLDSISAATNEAHVWSPSVCVTTDFEKTVNSSRNMDDYLRPVQWIVSGKGARKEVLVILSPTKSTA